MQEKVYKTRITDLDELKQRLRTDWAKLDRVVSGVVDRSRSLIRVLYIFSCNSPHTLQSTGFKSGEFGGHI